jgi:hypothetical protein
MKLGMDKHCIVKRSNEDMTGLHCASGSRLADFPRIVKCIVTDARDDMLRSRIAGSVKRLVMERKWGRAQENQGRNRKARARSTRASACRTAQAGGRRA